MIKFISYEKLLSFWIVLYSIGYAINIFKYNPILLLFIAYLFAIISTIYIIYNYNKNTQLFYFILINSIIKLPFIFLIWNKKIINIDIIFTCVFIFSYVIYMKLIDEDIICFYRDIIQYFINYEDGGSVTPLYSLYKDYVAEQS
jgi:hypothetical protein